ncbi:MAG: SDR family NAD(P)-dependent oxidoreductase [Anaerolineae bacterium]|nr:SDR family NAD(P)-dependent oxidoreductase [Anaerolineae bacterium]
MIWSDKSAIVTGASSGIGYATALRLAQEGIKVALVARRMDRLNALADCISRETHGLALPIQADLSGEADPVRVIQTVHRKWEQTVVELFFSWALNLAGPVLLKS